MIVFILRFIKFLYQILGFFPSVLRPFLVAALLLSVVFIVFTLISSLWRLIGK